MYQRGGASSPSALFPNAGLRAGDAAPGGWNRGFFVTPQRLFRL